jgi:beta-lactamase regulating signal transducer with metallopeptidase domain
MNADSTAILTWLAIATLEIAILLTLALIIELTVARSPAARHAVLFWALIAAGACPLLTVAARWSGVTPHRNLTRLIIPAHFIAHAQAEPSSIAASPISVANAKHLRRFSTTSLLVAVWLIGVLAMLARLAHGLIRIRRLRLSASTLPAPQVASLAPRLTAALGWPLPEIYVSPATVMPIAIGFLRPVVILPQRILDQLDPQQLHCVVLHEAAHVARRDPLSGLYQRLLAAVFWFHPLVHIANRRLSAAREDLCDNHVLRVARPAEFAQTLLTIATSLGRPRRALPAATLINSPGALESRVARLLTKRRCTMTRVTRAKTAAIALTFAAVALAAAATAAPEPPADLSSRPAAADALPHSVRIERGATRFADGDWIKITEIRGTAPKMEAGNIYWVKGKYKLASHDKANLGASVTARTEEYARSHVLRTQRTTIEKGEGEFSLIFPMYHNGWPHVSFYPAGSAGNSFGGIYFGTGETLLKKSWDE